VPDSVFWIDTKLKPLSANRMHQGRKTDTKAYREYTEILMQTLPDLILPEAPLRIRLVACLSSKLADLDNVIKPFLDVLQKRYQFNDRDVYRIECEKKIVNKGNESLVFAFDSYRVKAA